MSHPVYRVSSFEILSNFTIRVCFDDATEQIIDLAPVLAGEIYGPLRNERVFRQVRIDPEVGTLVWPNGADFDPATLHDWPSQGPAMMKLAQRWAKVEA